MSDLFAQLLAGDGVLVLERVAPKVFAPRGDLPAWPALLVGEAGVAEAVREPGVAFPFLDHFLDDAEAWWSGAASEGKLHSGPWTEEETSGAAMHLEACARKIDGRAYLLVRHLEGEFARTHHALQTGRELALAHDRLLSETSKKEILLHCIVHDLNGPLSGIYGAFDILKMEKLSELGEKFLELGSRAAQQQANFIADMLDTFRAESGAVETLSTDPATAPDLLAAAHAVKDALSPAAEIRDLELRIVRAESTPEVLPVIGERNRLERIFHNFLQNALRYAPPESAITITVTRNAGEVLVTVDDCGLGIPPDVLPQLFQKFVRGTGLTGKAGLGLYFCRITAELWGGATGCENRPEGGARFWFRLKTLG